MIEPVPTMEDYEFRYLTKVDAVSDLEKHEIARFLHDALGEYGDEEEDILKCLDYAIGDRTITGGFVLLARKAGEIFGAVVINHTNMTGYIPENILVYIAVDSRTRGQGLGGKLMERALSYCKGDVALHVEPENPAKRLYERLGFSNKYLEMRWKNDK